MSHWLFFQQQSLWKFWSNVFEKNSYLKVWRAHFVILFGSQQPENFPPNIGFSTLTPKLSHEWLVAVLSYNIISTFTLNLIVKWLERRFASDIFPILKVSCWQDKSKLKSFSQKPLLGKLKCVVSLPSHVLLIFLQNNQLVLLPWQGLGAETPFSWTWPDSVVIVSDIVKG